MTSELPSFIKIFNSDTPGYSSLIQTWQFFLKVLFIYEGERESRSRGRGRSRLPTEPNQWGGGGGGSIPGL